MSGKRVFFIRAGKTVTVSLPKKAIAEKGDIRSFDDWFYEDLIGGNAFDFPWKWA